MPPWGEYNELTWVRKLPVPVTAQRAGSSEPLSKSSEKTPPNGKVRTRTSKEFDHPDSVPAVARSRSPGTANGMLRFPVHTPPANVAVTAGLTGPPDATAEAASATAFASTRSMPVPMVKKSVPIITTRPAPIWRLITTG